MSETTMVSLNVDEGTKEIRKLISDKELVEIKTHCEGLEIKGIDDRMGFDLVRTSRLNVRRKRLDIEKRSKEVIEPYKNYLAEVKSFTKNIVDELKGLETILRDKEQPITDELQRIKDEKLREVNDRIIKRTLRMNLAISNQEINMVGTEYVNEGGEVISVLAVQDMEENAWIEFMGEAGLTKKEMEEVEAKFEEIEDKLSTVTTDGLAAKKSIIRSLKRCMTICKAEKDEVFIKAFHSIEVAVKILS